MKYRNLGKTGIEVSEIGFGAWGIGGSMWIGGRDEQSLKALHQAMDLGVNFIDTAAAYGDGHSEQLIGACLKERSERIQVATKIAPLNYEWPAAPDSKLAEVFPVRHIIESTEKSLRHLGLDTLDLQQFHVWNDKWANQSEWQEAVTKLKQQGKVRHFGISMNDMEPENGLAAAESGLIDVFQVIYNIFEQAPEAKLFPYCRQKGIGIIARVPLDEGALTGNIGPETEFPKGDWRRNYFGGVERKKEVKAHVEKLRFLLHDGVETLTEAALRFCLSHAAVSTVIAGMRSADHVAENCKVSDGRPLPGEDLLALRSHVWPHNFY